MTEFQQKSCILVKGFIDPQAVQTLSRYMEYAVKNNEYNKLSDRWSKYARYADPLMETVLYNSKEEVEHITGLELDPTYAYARVYVKGDEMPKHTDRPSCEISITVNVATKGELWPIWMQVPGQEPISMVLEPGDAVVYKGCEVPHWREKAVNTDVTAQFMLHYVDKNGPSAGYKFDTRPSLGMPISSRLRSI